MISSENYINIINSDDFVRDGLTLIELAKQVGHFSLGYSDFHRVQVANPYFGSGKFTFEKWVAKSKIIFELIINASVSCTIYGLRLDGDEFYGHGEVIKSLMKKGVIDCNKLKEINFMDIAFFWAGIDKKRPPKYPGENYFVVPIERIDWYSFFRMLKNPKVIPNLNAVVKSKIGLKKALEIVDLDESVVVVSLEGQEIHFFFNRRVIGRFAAIAAAVCIYENAKGGYI